MKNFNVRQCLKTFINHALNPVRSFDWLTLNCARHSAAFSKEGKLAIFTQTILRAGTILSFSSRVEV